MPKTPSRALLHAFALASVAFAWSTLGCRSLVDPGDVDTLDPRVRGAVPGAWTASYPGVHEDAATAWSGDFRSKALVRLVREAVGGNFDLAATSTRVRQASARARIVGSDRLPQFDADLRTSRSQNLRGAQFQSVRANQFSTGLNLSWEIDLWGRLNNLRKSALAGLDATSADYYAARLSLAANVTKTALTLFAAEKQIEQARKSLRSLQTNLDILDRKFEIGDVDDRTPLDVSLSRADVARARATIADNQRQADAAKRQLETLLGRYPAASLDALTKFPDIRRNIPAGLPSDLLLRRPDVVAAERRVDAALEDLAASRKALLPSFRITGGAGRSATDQFIDLLDPNTLVWNIAGALGQPIFQGGRLVAEIDLDEAERDEIAAVYADVALQAFREVETALAAESYYREQETQLIEAAVESERAEELALSQYENGLVEIITVLESQRRAFDARSALINVKSQRLQNRIDLYLALGGDFDTRTE